MISSSVSSVSTVRKRNKPPVPMAFGKKSRSTLLGVLVIIGVVLFLIPRIHLGKDSLSGRPGDKLISDYDILESLVVGRDYWDIRPDRHPETLTLEGVSFALPDDYLASRILQLGNSEACVVFTGDSFFPGFARLVLRIYPDIADDTADEAVNEMLEAAVDNLAKMLIKDVEESGREQRRPFHKPHGSDAGQWKDCVGLRCRPQRRAPLRFNRHLWTSSFRNPIR